MNTDNRKHDRYDALNLIAYSCHDNEGMVTLQGMGRTLNVSQGGILLETHQCLDPDDILILKIGIKEETIDIKGNIVYCKASGDEKYETGVEFAEPTESAMQVLNRYIVEFKKTNKLLES